MSNQQKAILIGGMPKSGTSLLRSIIGSHSQTGLLPREFDFFRKRSNGERLEQILTGEKIACAGLDLRDLMHSPDSEVYTTVMERYASKLDKPIIGEKSPYNEFFHDKIEDWFQGHELKFVQIVRHPMDAVASFMHAPWLTKLHVYDSSAALKRYLANWKRSTSIGLAKSYSSPASYYLIRYELLVSDPEGQVENLCRFLGITFEPETMIHQPTFSRSSDNSSFPEEPETLAERKKFIYQPSSRGHKLTKSQIKIISKHCGELGSALDYSMPIDTANSLPQDYGLVGLTRELYSKGKSIISKPEE